jgi:DNA-binding CsgD family transcriptional regulator
MSRRAALVQAEGDVVRHCHSGLDVAALQKQLLVSIRRLLSVDAAFFATADPDTLLFTSAYADEPLAAATPLFLTNEFGVDDVNKFASLAVSSSPVATLDAATRGDRGASVRARDIMQPLGLGDELRAALCVGSVCWGYLCLHREDHPRGFSSSESAAIARLAPHIAHALRQATLLHEPSATGGTTAPGVVLLDEHLTVVATTAEAEYLLSIMTRGKPARYPLPMIVYTVAAALRTMQLEATPSHVLPSARVQAANGQWLNVHASRLQDTGGAERVAVIIEPLQARATVPLLLSAHGLTDREVEVARLVIRGASTRDIVDALHISKHTVQDHLKSVFDKTGVHSRRELVGQLLARSIPDP